MGKLVTILCDWLVALWTGGECRHVKRMAPRLNYETGKFVETCLGCGQSVKSDFDMDTKLYYLLRKKEEVSDGTITN